MKEIGGYIEFEYYHWKMLHEDGIKLDCGRSCLAYLIEAKRIKKIAMPSFMCDAVFNLCTRYGVEMDFYKVGYDLKPEQVCFDNEEYLYLANYYGQLTNEEIKRYKEMHERIIVDNTQAYFSEPVENVDTLYTCRKYFGVPDGGILYTDKLLSKDLPRSESFNQMEYLMGRFERSASEFYEKSSINNDRFEDQPTLQMSLLTENLLHGINYEFVKKRREENYAYLENRFGMINRLSVKMAEGPFAYPLMISENASAIRKQLAREKIYIPVLWPNVIKEEGTVNYDLAMNILPLPCDQRYGLDEMAYMADRIASML